MFDRPSYSLTRIQLLGLWRIVRSLTASRSSRRGYGHRLCVGCRFGRCPTRKQSAVRDFKRCLRRHMLLKSLFIRRDERGYDGGRDWEDRGSRGRGSRGRGGGYGGGYGGDRYDNRGAGGGGGYGGPPGPTGPPPPPHLGYGNGPSNPVAGYGPPPPTAPAPVRILHIPED